MVSRTRNRTMPAPQGRCDRLLQNGNYHSSYYRVGQSGSETCIDTVGQRSTINPLTLDRFEVVYGLINGTLQGAGTYDYKYNSWPFDVTASETASHYSVVLPSADAANILARTNPNRPSVSLPVFIAELKDLPGLVRQAGRLVRSRARSLSTARGAAEANLAYQFGMAPLLGDLSKMLDFTALVDKKREQMKRLHSKGGTKRRVSIGSVNLVGTVNSTEPDPGFNIVRTRRTEAERWATVRWKPTYSAIPSSSELDRMAWNAAFGLNLSISDVWELLPWSWLIDWFTNFGDLLAAHRGGVPVTPGHIAVMTRTVTTVTTTPAGVLPSGITIQGGSTQRKRTSLRRAFLSTSIILPSASIPFLGAGQLSILASLSILRGAR